jgi:hypothetical protein
VLPNFWIAAGLLSIDKDESDMPYLAMGSERFINVWDRVFAIFRDGGAYYLGAENRPDVPEYAVRMFSGNQSLFMDSTLFVIEQIRGVEIEFGIIPYPKLDERQENYISRMEYYMAMQVPVINPDPARAGIMLEALNSLSARTIIPAYYEVALKTKYARDDESAEMLDLIMSTLVVDIGDTTLSGEIRGGLAEVMFTRNERDIVSRIERTESVIQRWIDSIPQ